MVIVAAVAGVGSRNFSFKGVLGVVGSCLIDVTTNGRNLNKQGTAKRGNEVFWVVVPGLSQSFSACSVEVRRW